MLSRTLQLPIRSAVRTFATVRFPSNESDYRVFSVYRFNPEKDVKPHMESYAINIKE